jgi:hypothetical protein
MWSALALWSALVWDRMPGRLRAAGAIAVGSIGMISAAVALFLTNAAQTLNGNWGAMDERWTAWEALHNTPASTWLSLRPMLLITGVSLVSLSMVALYFISKQREKLAAIALSVAMIPTGFSMMEGVARIAPYFSLADLGRFLNASLDEKGQVLFEGSLNDGSSLIFYLNRKFSLVNQNPQKEAPLGTPSIDIFLDEDAVLKKWSQTEAVYLIVEQDRVDHWKSVLTDRFHVFHQVTTSGTHVVLTNQL